MKKVGISTNTIIDSVRNGTSQTLISEIVKLIEGGYEVSQYNQRSDDPVFKSADDVKDFFEKYNLLLPPEEGGGGES